MMDITCKNLMSDGSTGKINLTNVLAEGKLSIERSTGNVTFENVDAAEMNVKTNTGNVQITISD